MDAVAPVRSLGQRQVSLAHVFALPQRHVAHQQQPRAVAGVALCVLQAGSAGGGGAGGGQSQNSQPARFRTSRQYEFNDGVILTTHAPERVTEVDATAQVPGVCSLDSVFHYSNVGQQQTTDRGAAD